MRVRRDQKARFGRGNLVAAKAAIEQRNGRAAADVLREWARSRQKTARQKAGSGG